MKKLLLSLTFIGGVFTLSAQELQSENFNTLTIGNLAADFTGVTPGQDSFYLFASNGAAPTTTSNTDATVAQIVAGGNGSLGLQLTGPNGDKGSRYVWKNGLGAVWSARTTGNEIIELEIDINPGAGTSTSRNTFGAYIFDATGAKVLAGFFVRASTREVFFVAYSTPTGNPVGNYNYPLAAAPGIQLPANTFSRIGISYDKETGWAMIKGPGIDEDGLGVLTTTSLSDEPGEVDIVAFSGHVPATPNTSAASMIFDNLVVRASETDTLLGLDKSIVSNDLFVVYPNPVNDVVGISLLNNNLEIEINKVTVSDVNGRIVKEFNSNLNQLNVSDLNSGVYFLNIETENGKATKKIVKQ
jgi:hypothetical protein